MILLKEGRDIKGGVKNSKVAAANRNQEMSVGSRGQVVPTSNILLGSRLWGTFGNMLYCPSLHGLLGIQKLNGI